MQNKPERQERVDKTFDDFVLEIVYVATSLISVGLLSGFIEYFFAHEPGWDRVLRATITVSILHAVMFTKCWENMKDYPVCNVYVVISHWFVFTSVAAVFFLFHVTLGFSIIAVAWEFVQTGVLDFDNTNWHEVFRWSILTCYFLGGIVSWACSDVYA